MKFNIEIGNKLLALRKKNGLTQAEVAEGAGISDRTYADIERSDAIMRIDTLLKICKVLKVTPNDILIENEADSNEETSILKQLDRLPPKNKQKSVRSITKLLHKNWFLKVVIMSQSGIFSVLHNFLLKFT